MAITADSFSPRALTPPPGVMRAPTDAANYRVKIGNWGERWYCDPWPADDIAPAAGQDEVWPAVSLVKDAAGWRWSIVAATTTKRLAASSELAEIAALETPLARAKRMKVVDELEGERARTRGANVHTTTEAGLYGIPSPLAPDAVGYEYNSCVARMLAELQPRLVASEFVAIHRTLNGAGYGGTGDAIWLLDNGQWIVDYKSRGEDSDHGAYPEDAAQVGAYARAEYWIVDDGQGGARRIRPLPLTGGLIISIKPDSYEVYPIDLDEAFGYFASLHAFWLARRSDRRSIGRRWAPATPAKAAPATILEQARARQDADRARSRAEHPTARPPEDQRPADEGDVAKARGRFERMSEAQRRWTGAQVRQAIEAGQDFRVTVRAVQRRADLYLALTEWALHHDDPATSEDAWRVVLSMAAEDPTAMFPTLPLGAVLGCLRAEEARRLRDLVTSTIKEQESSDA